MGNTFKVSFDANFQNQFEELKAINTEIVEFSFLPENFTGNILDTFTPDKRIKITILHILKSFFAENEKAIIYNCLTVDNKQKARSKLFNKWFKEANIKYLVKFDSVITIDEVPTFFQSLIVHKQNHKIEEVKELFFKLTNELNK